MEVLGQLLAAHLVLPDLAGEQQVAEFAAHVLRSAPGADATAARLGEARACDGVDHADCDGLLRQLTSTDATTGWREVPDGRSFLLLRVATPQHRYGGVGVLTSSPDEIDPYVASLENFAAALALTLDNQRQRAELDAATAQLRDSRRDFELLFDEMTSGFAVHEMIADEAGKPVDYRFLQVNRAFEKLTGLRRGDILGRTAREILPELEHEWIATYGQVAIDGRHLEFESYSADLDRFYHVVAYRPSPGKFATVFDDITEQKEAEQKLKTLYDEQRRIALTLQQHFMHPLPAVEGVELALVSQAANEPELVGGDFSDVFLLEDGRVVIVIGDVAGKGVDAAGLTETVRSTVRALALVDSSPAFLLRKSNELLLAGEVDSEQFVTVLIAVFDPQTGGVEYSSAGHPPAVRVGQDGSRPLETFFSTPLGMMPADFRVARATLAPSETLVLYTDGVIEARRSGGELFGQDRLLETLSAAAGESCEAITRLLQEAARDFAGSLKDDLLVVALRLRREPHGRES
jgi:PAS domain S-box-containing protein